MLLGVFLTLEVFLVPQVGNYRFALVGFLDLHPRAVEVVHGQQVQGHLRGQHDLFVVIAFVAPNFIVDQKTAELGEILACVELDRIFPLAHLLVSAGPSRLAAGQIALGTQQLTFFEEIQQVFVLAGVVLLQQGQRRVDVAGSQLLIGLSQFAVVVAKRRAARQQGDRAEGDRKSGTGCHEYFFPEVSAGGAGRAGTIHGRAPGAVGSS